jgi:hypothetical protein
MSEIFAPDEVIKHLRVGIRRRRAVVDRDLEELQSMCRHAFAYRHTVATSEYSYYVECGCPSCGKTWREI